MEGYDKRPLKKEELVTLFDTGNIPQFLVNKYNYISDDLRDFYVGMTRRKEIYTDGNPRYTYIIKKVIVQSNYIKLPYRRGSKVVRNWTLGNYALNNAPIVIILDVTEYKFSLDAKEPINYNLIGIFNISTFKDELIKANNSLNNLTEPFEDFSPLSRVGSNLYNLEIDKLMANIRKNKSPGEVKHLERSDGRISINKEQSEASIIGQNYDMNSNIDSMVNDYINEAIDDNEEIISRSAIQENIDENKKEKEEMNRRDIEKLIVNGDELDDSFTGEDSKEKEYMDFEDYINSSDEDDENGKEEYDNKSLKLQTDVEYFGLP